DASRAQAASRLSQLTSSEVSATERAETHEAVSAGTHGPISAKVGKAWVRTQASAILIGSTFRSAATAGTRASRLKLSSLYQHRTSSASDRSSGRARPVKNPRAWLDHDSTGIWVRVRKSL